MKKIIWTFGLTATALLLLFQLSKYSAWSGSWSQEVSLALVALVFGGLGFVLTREKRGGKMKAEPAPSSPLQRLEAAGKAGLSKREYEVLQQMAGGLSNREIARALFVTESTVKTHVSNLLSKLGAERRTQAVHIAREKGLI